MAADRSDDRVRNAPGTLADFVQRLRYRTRVDLDDLGAWLDLGPIVVSPRSQPESGA